MGQRLEVIPRLGDLWELRVSGEPTWMRTA